MSFKKNKDELIFGDEDNNLIFGFKGNDYLFGLDGNDLIFGGKGNDLILGGNDSDFLFGNKGHDYVFGEHGSDSISGGKGNDYLYGGSGNDVIFGGHGHDYLAGGKGNDLLNGGSGKDSFTFHITLNNDVYSNEGDDKIIQFSANQDELIFSRDVKNLLELDNAIKNISHHHKTVTINFTDSDSSIVIHGVKGHINSVADLNDAINIRFEQEFRQLDGSENNLANPTFGKAGEIFLRTSDVDYLDGEGTDLSGAFHASPREVSNVIFNQEGDIPNPFGASNIFWLWGQFVDHDINLARQGTESFNIEVPTGDPIFDPNGEGGKEIEFFRVAHADGTGENGIPREQINDITPYVDASNVYGSSIQRGHFLRSFEDGKLKVSEGNLLPFNDAETGVVNADPREPNGESMAEDLFVGGDIRANEHVALTSMHTLWVREHNRIADEIKADNPHYTDEQIYQNTKILVEAEIQAITYKEFLPLLLGENALSEYTGYDANVNPTVANEFATAAYRLGHTLLSSNIARVNEDGSEIDGGDLGLRGTFFRPDLVLADGIDSVLRGIVTERAQELDAQVISDVRNFLFGEQVPGGLDLVAFNLQRGIDHGLTDYNSMREAYGLAKVTSFSEITSDIELQGKLEMLYGNVDNIDLFAGGLSEDPISGSQLGELFHTIVLDQFERLRDGDRFWYEDRLTEEQLDWVNSRNLSDVILDNTDTENLQRDVFTAYNRLGGTENDDVIVGDPQGANGLTHDLLIGFGGDDILIGGDNVDELHGGNGSDTLIGNSGGDFFVFAPSATHGERDVITDFEVGVDKIDLRAFNTNYDDVNITNNGSNTLITLANSNEISLEGVQTGDLTEDDFIF